MEQVMSRFQVDNVSLILRPIFYLHGYGMAILVFVLGLIPRTMNGVMISGRVNLVKHSNYIFCHWHTFILLALISAVPDIHRILDQASHAWLQHFSLYRSSKKFGEESRIGLNFWQRLRNQPLWPVGQYASNLDKGV